MSAVPKLFQPIKIGKIELAHRVVLAPLTRFRANKAHVHTDLAVKYYEQRSSVPGSLLITEATFIHPRASGLAHAPGIWSDEQVAAWKKVTDAVHANKSYIFCQLWALGRAANPDVLAAEDPSYDYVSASDVKLADKPKAPRPLTIAEIKDYVQWYATAATNAVRAGFDGVEIHGANGYLIHQFLEDVSNHRTDEYGGSIENRARFGLEVVDAVTKAVGADKVAIRLSPWNPFQGQRMKDPKPQYTYFVQKLKDLHSDLAYIHVVESRDDQTLEQKAEESNDFIRDIWAPRPIISASGYNAKLALEVAEKKGDLIAFGRHYIANPDLPVRLQKNLPLQEGDRTTYYSWEDPKGYVDYPFYNDVQVSA